jgi:hypothetical protein
MVDHTTPATAFPPRAERVRIRSQRRAHWAWFDHALIDDYAQHLGPIGVALYIALTRYANHHTGQCWPSLVRLSHQLGITRLTARRYLQRLVDQGLIALQERPGHTFLVTLLELSPRSQTCLPGKQGEDLSCLPDKQGDVHAGRNGCIRGKHEPDLLNQHNQTTATVWCVSQGHPEDSPKAQEQADELDTRFQALSPDAHAALRQQAKAHLTAQGIAPWLQIGPVVEATLFQLLAREPRQEPAGPAAG